MRPLVAFRPIPEGDAGALATLRVMQNLVHEATGNPWAVAVARRLVGASVGDDADDLAAKIAAVFDEHFRFSYDPAPMDRVSSPVLLLQEWSGKGVVRGDCDDAAVLAAFLAAVHYVPWKFRAVGFSPVGPLTHVYTILRGRTHPIDLDVTKNPKQVVPAARRALDFP
jgi:hypothetical protein